MSSNCILLIVLIHLCKFRMLETKMFSHYKITTFNQNERSVLYKLYVLIDELIFLNGVTNDASLPIDIIMKDSYSEDFENLLDSNDIEYYKLADNLDLYYSYKITNENLTNETMEILDIEANITAQFLQYSWLSDWASAMCKKHRLLKKNIIGKTFEQRDIFVLKLSSSSNIPGKKPAVFILGGEQGRDWMSPAIIINFIQMVTEKHTPLSELFDFYFLPILNPDGYAYTMKKCRFWNKNRRAFYPTKICNSYYNTLAIGVNIDRNFFFADRSSSDECDSVHPGQHSLSEKESISLAAFLNTIAYDMMAFINIRGYENLITLPYANPNMLSNNHGLVYEILDNSVRKANEIFNTSIKVDTTAKCFFNMSGNIPDWVKKNLNTPIVYTEFLSNENQFLQRVEDIIPLTNQFVLILNETLQLSNKMYRPLFNQELIVTSNFILLLFCGISSTLIKFFR